MNNCKKCGAENAFEAQFCKECGAKLENIQNSKTITFKLTTLKWHGVTKLSSKLIIFIIPLFIISIALLLNYYKLNYYYKYSDEFSKIENLIREEERGSFDDLSEIDSSEEREALISLIGQSKAAPLILLSDQHEKAIHYYSLFELLSGVFAFSLLFCVLLFCAFFLIYNKRWKKFILISGFQKAKDSIIQFVFSQNKTEERITIRENVKGELKLKDKSLGAKGYFHLITDKNGDTLLIGEKYNTQAFIRSVFGKDVNFIEN